MLLTLRQISSPSVEPVSLSLAKQHLVLEQDFGDDDVLIQNFVRASREYAETYSNRCFYDQTLELTLDYFPCWLQDRALDIESNRYGRFSYYPDRVAIKLPRPSCVSVTSITYLDLTGTLQTLSPDSYYVDTSSEPARVVPVSGAVWPLSSAYLPGSVKVRYIGSSYGDGETVDTCPSVVITAILLLVGHFYANREATTQASLTNIPMGVNILLDTIKFHTFSYGY